MGSGVRAAAVEKSISAVVNDHGRKRAQIMPSVSIHYIRKDYERFGLLFQAYPFSPSYFSNMGFTLASVHPICIRLIQSASLYWWVTFRMVHSWDALSCLTLRPNMGTRVQRSKSSILLWRILGQKTLTDSSLTLAMNPKQDGTLKYFKENQKLEQ